MEKRAADLLSKKPFRGWNNQGVNNALQQHGKEIRKNLMAPQNQGMLILQAENQPHYANVVSVGHTPEEFLLFARYVISDPAGNNTVFEYPAVVMSPAQAKRFHKHLGLQIELYERNNGEIKDLTDKRVVTPPPNFKL